MFQFTRPAWGATSAITAVKAKRKDASKTADTAGKTADTAGKTADTLVGTLQAALHAAKNGNLEVAETWLNKAQALLETAKIATAQAIEKMGGIGEKTKKTA